MLERGNFLAWSGFAVIAAVWLLFYRPFLLNVPRGDDLISLLPFACDWSETPGWTDRLELLFAQYFSHRIVLTRVITLGVIGVFGHVHLVALQVLGLLLWLGLVLWIAQQAAQRHQSAAAALPVALLLLQPLGHTNITTAMQAVQNHGILLFGLAVCVLAARPATPARTTGGFLAAAGGLLTSANGLVLPPLLAAAAFLRREWRAGCILATGAGALCWAWFHGYRLDSRPFAPGEFAANAFVMIGAPFNLGRLSVLITSALGAVLLLLVVAVLWRRRDALAADPAALFACFLLGSVALAAAARVGWGAAYMQQDRYSPYGLLLAATVWLLAPPLPSTARKFLLGAAILVAAFHSLLSYARVYPSMMEEKRWAVAVAANHHLGTSITLAENGGWTQEQVRALLAGLLRIPAPDFLGELTALAGHNTPSPGSSVVSSTAFLVRFDPGRGVDVLHPAGTAPPPPADYALVSDGTRLLLLPGICEREPYARMIRHGRLVNPERVGFIWPLPSAPAGPVRILGLERAAGGRLAVRWEGCFETS